VNIETTPVIVSNLDCIIDEGLLLFPVEIKSSETIASDFFSGLKEWARLTENKSTNNYIVYGGDVTQERTHGNIVGWKNASHLIETLRGLKP